MKTGAHGLDSTWIGLGRTLAASVSALCALETPNPRALRAQNAGSELVAQLSFLHLPGECLINAGQGGEE